MARPRQHPQADTTDSGPANPPLEDLPAIVDEADLPSPYDNDKQPANTHMTAKGLSYRGRRWLWANQQKILDGYVLLMGRATLNDRYRVEMYKKLLDKMIPDAQDPRTFGATDGAAVSIQINNLGDRGTMRGGLRSKEAAEATRPEVVIDVEPE